MNDQRTESWFNQRLGLVTASRVSDVMSKTKTGYSASRTNYMTELLCQRLTDKREEGFTSQAMQRGTDLEPIARSAYEFHANVLTSECGFITHPIISDFGASPDGLVGDDGLLEIKCPNTSTHIDFLRTSKPDNKYQWQMLAQMACANRQWCDFVSFDDRMPEYAQFKCIRFMRDESRIDDMISEILSFNRELDKLVDEIKSLNKGDR